MRNQTTITAARCFLFGTLALVHATAWAQDDAVADATKPEVPRFFVWQGECSRSLRITGSYFDERSALTSLYGAKPDGEIFITDGKDFWTAVSVLAYRRGAKNQSELECTVYGRKCRSLTWFVQSPEGQSDLKSAEELLANSTSLPIYRLRSKPTEKASPVEVTTN